LRICPRETLRQGDQRRRNEIAISGRKRSVILAFRGVRARAQKLGRVALDEWSGEALVRAGCWWRLARTSLRLEQRYRRRFGLGDDRTCARVRSAPRRIFTRQDGPRQLTQDSPAPIASDPDRIVPPVSRRPIIRHLGRHFDPLALFVVQRAIDHGASVRDDASGPRGEEGPVQGAKRAQAFVGWLGERRGGRRWDRRVVVAEAEGVSLLSLVLDRWRSGGETRRRADGRRGELLNRRERRTHRHRRTGRCSQS
jgi:hypothetical protein